jgi:hypothetical protein
MRPESLSLLKSLAIRPSPCGTPSLQAMVSALHRAGYVSHGPFGWFATAKGCEVLEQQRATNRARRP